MTTNDIVMETVNDVRNALVRAHFEQDDTKKKHFQISLIILLNCSPHPNSW
jgi:hypothetical protein